MLSEGEAWVEVVSHMGWLELLAGWVVEELGAWVAVESVLLEALEELELSKQLLRATIHLASQVKALDLVLEELLLLVGLVEVVPHLELVARNSELVEQHSELEVQLSELEGLLSVHLLLQELLQRMTLTRILPLILKKSKYHKWLNRLK